MYLQKLEYCNKVEEQQLQLEKAFFSSLTDSHLFNFLTGLWTPLVFGHPRSFDTTCLWTPQAFGHPRSLDTPGL